MIPLTLRFVRLRQVRHHAIGEVNALETRGRIARRDNNRVL